ncbi:hypothetical protein VitviT2T_002681 [Vitis vinifera]|uniref:DNA helicase n=2 Tax=Vitis vinifera TaxID=29760 RepID=F6I051_VITVI|nr:hypothetical protein VitviT2T_002681 [Vitis vinifera]
MHQIYIYIASPILGKDNFLYTPCPIQSKNFNHDYLILRVGCRYFHFVKGYLKPVLTKVAEKVISSYYQLQRRSATHNAARTTVRMLGSLIRLAQAHARLMFRNEVTRLDAITAILCIESSMTTSAIVDSVGNALHSNLTENPDQECIPSLCVHS